MEFARIVTELAEEKVILHLHPLLRILCIL
jgi:hypothetical protein